MSIEISRETEVRLAARKLGISVDALLARLISEHAALTQPAQPVAGLPVWHLGGADALHHGALPRTTQPAEVAAGQKAPARIPISAA